MQKAILSIIVVFIFIAQSLLSQNIDYKSYKYPEISRRALYWNANYSQYQGSEFNVNYGTIIKSNNFQLNSNIYYQKFDNAAFRQKLLEINFNSQVYSVMYSPNISFYKDRWSINNSVMVDWLTRKYGSTGSFFEFGLNNYSYHWYGESSNYFTGMRVNLKIGTGRIEYISDVFLAKYIADELYEQGVINDPISQELLFEFSNKIAEINNARIFDYRRYRVAAAKSLADWIKSHLIVDNEKETELVVILLDNWLYSITAGRTQGQRIAAGFSPSFLYQYFNENDKTNFTGFLYGEFSKHTAKSKSVQVNHYIVAGFDPNPEKINSQRVNGMLRYVFDYGINPNSRTFISLAPELMYMGYYKNDINKFQTIAPKFNITANYFVSNNLRVTLNANLGYNVFIDGRNNIIQNFYSENFYPVSNSNLNSFGTSRFDTNFNRQTLSNQSYVSTNTFNYNINAGLGYVFY